MWKAAVFCWALLVLACGPEASQPETESRGTSSPTGATAPASSCPGGSSATPPGQSIGDGFTVEVLSSRYRIASGGVSGWFVTGQDADIMLSGIDFNNTGGPLLFNHPGGIATDGTRLLLADRNNNRVLIWNRLPAQGDVAPDLVLGQGDFTTNTPGKTLADLNWPVGIATDGRGLAVTDTYNDRVLVWRSFPTRNKQPADFAIKDRIVWPWGIGTDGAKLIVTSTGARTVLVWNRFPGGPDQKADLALSLPEFGTPRTVGSDGQRLVIADHNAQNNQGNQGTFFWRSFPARSDQSFDFFMVAPPPDTYGQVLWGPTFTVDGRFAAVGRQLNFWNGFPENGSDAPDLAVGTSDPSSDGCSFKFDGGDSSGMAHAAGQLFISMNNGNRVVVYRTLPTQSTSRPDFAIGSPDVDTNTLLTRRFITNGVPVTDGRSLLVASGYDHTLSVWKDLPDESGATPDLVYRLPGGAEVWAAALFQGRLYLAGTDRVYVWDQLPLEPRAPSRILTSPIGGVSFRKITGIAQDGSYFYLADRESDRVYGWRGIPEADTPPAFTLEVTKPGRISSDGRYLAVSSIGNGDGGRVTLYDVASLGAGKTPIPLGGSGFRLNMPEAVLVAGGALFVADTPNSRVLVWRRVDEAASGRPPDVVLGENDLQDTTPEIGRNKLFWPGALAFDGTYLWVAEFKFSNRVLRFSVRP